MTKAEFQALLDKYLNGSASTEESKLLDQFFDSYRTNPGEGIEISEEIKAEILQTVTRRRGSAERNIQSIPWMRIAAAISFFVIASYLVFNQFRSKTETKPELVLK